MEAVTIPSDNNRFLYFIFWRIWFYIQTASLPSLCTRINKKTKKQKRENLNIYHIRKGKIFSCRHCCKNVLWRTWTAWRCPPKAARQSGTRWYLPLEFSTAPRWIRSIIVSTWPPPAASDKGVLLFASSQSTRAIWCLAMRDWRAGSDRSDLLESSS